MDLAEKVLHGDERSASRLITLIENGTSEGYDAVSRLFPSTGSGHIIGVTGTPGAGKSTLIDKLAISFNDKGHAIGIVGIDPTSPKSNGALLGDRIRMTAAEKRPGIFIRSMAHRGYPGGISRAALGTVYVLQALGKDIVIVESVGVGQTELGLSAVCDTLVTVLTADYGDDIQLMKAGLIEVGDIVVVNKGDHGGSADVARHIAMFLSSRGSGDTAVPVLVANSLTGQGIDTICTAIQDHGTYLRMSGERERKQQEKRTTLALSFLKETIWERILELKENLSSFGDIMRKLDDGVMDPYSAARNLSRMIRIEGEC